MRPPALPGFAWMRPVTLLCPDTRRHVLSPAEVKCSTRFHTPSSTRMPSHSPPAQGQKAGATRYSQTILQSVPGYTPSLCPVTNCKSGGYCDIVLHLSVIGGPVHWSEVRHGQPVGNGHYYTGGLNRGCLVGEKRRCCCGPATARTARSRRCDAVIDVVHVIRMPRPPRVTATALHKGTRLHMTFT